MRLRPPAIPLITVDPYFSVWSAADCLTEKDTQHWTNKPMLIRGTVNIDGTDYRFMGLGDAPALPQTGFDCGAFTSSYTFAGAGIELTARFTTPLIPDDLELLSRPVSYLALGVTSTDGADHTVTATLTVTEQICLDVAGQDEVVTETLAIGDLNAVKMGSKSQPILARDGDDLRIDWGYFYLAAKDAATAVTKLDEMTAVTLTVPVTDETLVLFAYDDIKSINYFGDHLPSYWNRAGKTIAGAIAEAEADYIATMARCDAFADAMFIDAVRAGGEKYAELLELALRQTLAAHKIAVTNDDEIIYISKECFSNGCAATVDVSYPSIPLFLLYNPELVRGMMRPIYRYARSDVWPFDFAPHDAGRYPIVDGQRYSGGTNPDKQMPVEECGNMLVMEAATAVASGDVSFAEANLPELEQWVRYLLENGRDPENQLCTDDFAGHFAHNCNLSLKAIMGIAGLGVIYRMLGREDDAEKHIAIARDMAADWAVRASNGDGSYRLAFDRPGTFSMKYNIVWDKLFGTNVMDKAVIASEFASYRRRTNAYGLPLDNRKLYTKSDWLVWTATLAEDRDDFEEMIAPMWLAFHRSQIRVPMTDWYWTNDGEQRVYHKGGYGFQNRTVQGGLYIKLLEYKGIMKI